MNILKMKRFVLLFLMVFLTETFCFSYDHIIFRNGQENDVKLFQINDETIVFEYVNDKAGVKTEVPSKDVYMIYIEKQGNIYITPDGKRITGESKRVNPKKNDVIYLVEGKEIAANKVRISEDAIRYYIIKKEAGFSGLLKKGEECEFLLKKSEVFMIRYRSGMVDIITPIDNTNKDNDVSENNDNKQPEYIVVFHAVKKGESLGLISKKFNVTYENLVEWNELPSRYKLTTPLPVGMQLMIYQPKK